MSLLMKAAARVSGAVGRTNPLIQRLRPSYERLLDAVNANKGIPWRVNDELIRIDPRVRRLVAQTTEPELWEYLKATTAQGQQVLDVGSFLGVYAVILARWGGPGARVLAFEPTPSSIQTLKRHLVINGVADRVDLMPKAVGEQPGETTIYEHSDPYRNAIGFTDPNGVGTSKSVVPVTTLDQTCEARQFQPTLLRMDVQGFEYAVLKGARRTIASGRGRLKMVLEVHPQLWGQLGVTERLFDELVEELGLRLVPLRANGPRYEPDGHVALEYV